jgi:hypothetical protein
LSLSMMALISGSILMRRTLFLRVRSLLPSFWWYSKPTRHLVVLSVERSGTMNTQRSLNSSWRSEILSKSLRNQEELSSTTILWDTQKTPSSQFAILNQWLVCVSLGLIVSHSLTSFTSKSRVSGMRTSIIW